MKFFVTVGVVALAGSTLAAQNPSERTLAVGERQFVRERVPLERIVKGAPYSAEVVTELSQTLADGNRINQRTTGRVYRDGEGRTRREEDRRDGTVAISIVDPVAGVSYSLDPERRIAWKSASEASEAIMRKIDRDKELRMKMEEERRRAASDPPSEAPPAGELQRRRKAELEAATVAAGRIERGPAAEEHKEGALERKTLEGVMVEGRRTTTTIRAGAIGNDLPITITSEEWASPDLKVLVMTRRSDPRNGDSSYKLQNIVRGEPDRSLFQVPGDYTIKETGIRKFEEAR